ncbi:MAG: DUF2922 domain-containing protein [Caldicoprobacterales bacterium]
MRQVLVLEFLDSEAKKFNLRIADPRDDLTSEEVQAAMEEIINKNPFDRPSLIKINGAYIVTTTEEQIVFGA